MLLQEYNHNYFSSFPHQSIPALKFLIWKLTDFSYIFLACLFLIALSKYLYAETCIQCHQQESEYIKLGIYLFTTDLTLYTQGGRILTQSSASQQILSILTILIPSSHIEDSIGIWFGSWSKDITKGLILM